MSATIAAIFKYIGVLSAVEKSVKTLDNMIKNAASMMVKRTGFILFADFQVIAHRVGVYLKKDIVEYGF